MKKLLSLLLAGTLLASLALPAAGADDTSARLAKVTQAVKTALDLDTEAYGDFQGECYDEELAPVWHLFWSDGPDGASLSVEALEDGTISSYHVNSDINSVYRGWSLPAFPPAGAGEDEARQLAEAFLEKVLAANETVTLESSGGSDSLSRTGYRFSGTIQLNGLDSPLGCFLTVQEGQVIRFSRDTAAATFLGDVPSPEASAGQAKAAADLRAKLDLNLEYVLPEPGSKQAVLRYVPDEDQHVFYVDAKTGQLLDLTELKEGLFGGVGKNEFSADMAAPMATAAGAERGLSPAEQEGVKKLAGVLDAGVLDAALREVEAYGLESYTLASTSYTLERDGDADKPVCRLRYSRSDGDDSYLRTFTVDARTGKVLQLYGSSPWGKEAVLTQEQAMARAEAFLEAFAPDQTLVFRKALERSEKGVPYFRFSYSRQSNGCPFAANYYSIAIDCMDGTVCSLDYAWDEDVTFDSPDGVITPEAAKNAWADTYEAVLAYRLVPQDLDAKDPIQARLISQGLKRCYGLRLTYSLECEKDCQGIDAKSGEAVCSASGAEEEAVSYTDIAGNSAQADIEKLARYGVGYAAPEFRPGKVITQWEFVALLASTQDWRLDPAEASEEERDSAYNTAYSMGALTRAERSDGAAVSRGALVKMLLDSAGYGPAARLSGIYATSYTDQASIPAGDLGYAALAQALGMTKDTYAAARNVTRGEAASMLCRILERP